ncbi:MAG: pyridoxine 5'-phosphate synthase, partial [Kiritimatiellae bacterium]|nr:pyridoxine 5'-phosphate synthase [Kiritimatiellia bacterium]
LREDRRHIHDSDVYSLRNKIRVRLNLEMANNPEIVAVALKVRPDEVCIVPEKRQELTTEGGLDVAGQISSLRRTVNKLSKAGIIVSLFIDPEERQIGAAVETGAPWIEMHTGCFCNAKGRVAEKELKRLINGARYAHRLGLRVNAGHGINLDNIDDILQIPYLNVLNIGHSIISRSVMVGLKAAVKEMLDRMATYKKGNVCDESGRSRT